MSPSQAKFWTVVRDHLYSSPYVSLSFHYNLASFPLLTKIVLVNVTIDVQGVKCKGNFQGQLIRLAQERMLSYSPYSLQLPWPSVGLLFWLILL